MLSILVLLASMLSAQALNGSLRTVSFLGPVTGRSVIFTLYLPPGYAAGTNRYPVVYHLHGLGGSHDGQQTNSVPSSHEAAVAAGLIEPCIIVFPDGYRDSFWADSVNSLKPAETNVRDEIIPYVDAQYRTVADRRRRVIQGFSMGGFGAAKFAAKFPETFCACVIYDGAMLTWAQVQQRYPIQAAEIFDSTASVFDQYSPWFWLPENAETLRQTGRFRSVVGALLNENRSWRDALQAESVPLEYVESGCAHQLPCLLETQGSNAWTFISAAFAADAIGASLSISRQGVDIFLRWPASPGARFGVQQRANLVPGTPWLLLATNIPAGSNATAQFVHSNALLQASGFYRVALDTNTPAGPDTFSFSWTGTNFSYSDSYRAFNGILLKPDGNGPFPAVVINHGAGGSATGYSLQKAREMLSWGLVCIAPNLTHTSGGETNSVNMGYCPENAERIAACLNVLATRGFVDTNRLAIFGHSMGAFASVGSSAGLAGRLRAGAITSGGIIPDAAGTTNAAPTVGETLPVRTPFLMVHCDADSVVPPARSLLLQQVLASNAVPNQRILLSSNSIADPNHWHNIHNDASANAVVLTNTRAWLRQHGVLP